MNIQSASYSGLQGLQRASAGVTEATLDINRQAQASQQARQDVSQQNVAQQNAAQQNETQQAVTAADNSAQTRAVQNPLQPELTDSLVRLNSEERNAQANVRSIQSAGQVLGSVIDIRV